MNGSQIFWPGIFLLAGLFPSCTCRDYPPAETSGDLDFGQVFQSTIATRVVALSPGYTEIPETSSLPSGLEARWIQGDESYPHLLVVTCDPSLLEIQSGEITLKRGSEDEIILPWNCASTSRPAHFPDPVLVEIGIEDLGFKEETGLGTSDVREGEGARLFHSPSTGDTFLTDPAGGRVWRQGPLYVAPSWGVWATVDMESFGDWDPPPDCFEGGNWRKQDGSCTGEERNADGTIPYGFYYIQRANIGDDVDLRGVRTGVGLPDIDLLALAGERDGKGFLAVVDAGIIDVLSDEDSSSYLKLVRFLDGDLPEGLELAWAGETFYALDPSDGRLYTAVDLDTTTPRAVEVTDSGFQGQVTSSGSTDGGLLVSGSFGLGKLDDQGFGVLPDSDLWGPLDGMQPDLLAGDGELVWAWYQEPAMLAWRDEDGTRGGFVSLAHLDSVLGLAADRIQGGEATTAQLAWVTAELAGQPVLLSVLAETDLVESQGLALPTTPMALSVDHSPHDLFLAYPAGEGGCDGSFSGFCDNGSHATLIHSLYAPYGLVPPTSGGHILNMFMNPILETPKDSDLNTDFSKGNADCGDPEEGVYADLHDGCCALEWSTGHRLIPNMDYFLEDWTTGSGGNEDVTIVVGVNPTWLRQVYECFYAGGAEQERAVSALETLAYYRDMGVDFTNWTHTSLADEDPEEPMSWFINQLYEEGIDWSSPVDRQAEYDMLHDGLASVFDYGDLGEVSWEGTTQDLRDWEIDFIAGSGNSYDGGVMLDPDEGWPDDDPSWVRAIRDGPLAVGRDPLLMFYFASAGGIPEVDILGWRKKELFPIDIRTRAAVFEIGENPEDWYLGGNSGMIYAPGSSWALNTWFGVAESGMFRESMSWGTDLTQEDWEMVIRYLRRILASSQPDDIKSWYMHVYDISNAGGSFTANSGVTSDSDITVDALLRIQDLLITPGYARWSRPQDIYDEWADSSP